MLNEHLKVKLTKYKKEGSFERLILNSHFKPPLERVKFSSIKNTLIKTTQ